MVSSPSWSSVRCSLIWFTFICLALFFNLTVTRVRLVSHELLSWFDIFWYTMVHPRGKSGEYISTRYLTSEQYPTHSLGNHQIMTNKGPKESKALWMSLHLDISASTIWLVAFPVWPQSESQFSADESWENQLTGSAEQHGPWEDVFNKQWYWWWVNQQWFQMDPNGK